MFLHDIHICRRDSIERFERAQGCARAMGAFGAYALESLQNGFERLRKLHQPHIGKFYVNRQMILILSNGD